MEFGLVIGLFMLVVGGLVQFGVILWTQNSISQIARDTARYAVTLSESPCDSATTRNLVAQAANKLAMSASLVSYSGGSWATASTIASVPSEGIGVDWEVPVGYDPSLDCPPSDNAIAVDIRVRINHIVPIFLPGLQLLAPPCAGSGFCLTTQAELRMEPKRP